MCFRPSDQLELGVFVDILVKHDALRQGVPEGPLQGVDLGAVAVHAGQEIVKVPIVAAGDQLGILLVLRPYVGDSALLPELGVDEEGLALEAVAVPAADQTEHIALALLRHLPVPCGDLVEDLCQTVRAVLLQGKIYVQIVLKQVIVVLNGPGQADDNRFVHLKNLSEIMQHSAAGQIQLLLAADQGELAAQDSLD